MVDGLAANVDLFATFAKLASGAGATTEFTTQAGWISKDLTPTLLEGKPSPRTQWLYHTGAVAFRSGKYKIHLSTKPRSSDPNTRQRIVPQKHDPPLLFDLTADLSESKNIAEQHPEVVRRLLTEFNAYQAE